jgi:hypothetical protein
MPERQQYQVNKDAQRRVARDLLDQKAASSRPGQVYHTMTSLQDRMARPGYTPAQADTDQLKALRRDWNRNQKYTPQGMRVSGATSPLDAQNRFMGATETFRQANPRAYGTMYPLSQGAMKLGEYGGLLGLGVRGLTGQLGKLGQDIKNKLGITGMVDDTIDVQDEYVSDTFGLNQPFYPSDVHPGLPIEEPLLVDEGQGLTREEQIEELLVNPGVKTDSELLLDKLKDDEQKREEGEMVFTDEPERDDSFVADTVEDVEPLPFDEGREDYIAASGMNPNLLRQEKLRGMGEIPENFVPGGSPQADRYYAEVDPGISLEFGANVAPPPINYGYDPRTESGIANLMPGGPLYDAIPWKQRLNMRIAEQMRERGPHANEPRTSYYGSNWYDEYKRKLENEREIAEGIRSPIDR